MADELISEMEMMAIRLRRIAGRFHLQDNTTTRSGYLRIVREVDGRQETVADFFPFARGVNHARVVDDAEVIYLMLVKAEQIAARIEIEAASNEAAHPSK